jgi:hypothetical protein
MKRIFSLALLLLLTPLIRSNQVQASEIGPCSHAQLLAYSPPREAVGAHRQFSPPVIDYPFDGRKDDWGFSLVLRIDTHGQVICYAAKDDFGRSESLDGRRRDEIDRLATWRYQPFTREGKAVDAVVTENIYEQELPRKHIPLPDVPLGSVHIALARSGCFGSCPDYRVDIYGDGKVVYHGSRYVDVEGEHTYRIAPGDVAKLVDSLKAKDLWSLRDAYRARMTDNPTFALTIGMGGETHQLEDYVGAYAGMPRAVTDFEEEVDRAAQSDIWIHLQQPALGYLKAEGFRFDSPEGFQLLSRAVSNRWSHDDRAMLGLIKLGAPIMDAQDAKLGFDSEQTPLIETALLNHRLLLIDPLIARGALDTRGKRDQNKVDAAFRAAIRGGRLAPVEKIWSVSAQQPHPSLSFDSVRDIGHSIKVAPVTLLLSNYDGMDKDWEGLAIAKWLIAKGCDMRASTADGTTLLHIAAEANDAEFVRYLLDQGMDPSTPGRYDLPALGGTTNEDVALMLLQAGSKTSNLGSSGRSFRDYAVSQHWARVVGWLDTHHAD